jgi:uncharacterized RDD family membrane protein YckC
MADGAGGGAGAGPPSFPGGGQGDPTAAPPPPMPPPMPPPPPPPPPPSYPAGYPPPPFGAPSGPEYASWAIRLAGYLIDLVILALVQGILRAVLRHSNTLAVHFTLTNNGTVNRYTFSLLAVIIGGLVVIAYATILIGGPRGQTIGMMVVAVRAVREDTMGVVGYGKAFGRALIDLVFRFTIIVGLIDLLFPLWDAKRQTLHDKVVGTVVLRVRNAG